jgi:amino acid adenylation domain-containing protein/thioester reductase-like protein
LNKDEAVSLIVSKKIKSILPLTPMQNGLLFHHLKNPDSKAYIEQMSFDLLGHMDPLLARQSLEILIARYDVLRTVFIYKKVEQPRQVVLEQRRCMFSYKDFFSDGTGSAEQRVQTCETGDRHHLFDLSRDMLLRLSVIRTGESRYRLIFSFHHIILDGWSLGILLNEFFEIYQLLSRNEEIIPVRDGYRNFVRWIQNRNHENSYRYWSDILAGFEKLSCIPGKAIHKSGNHCDLKETCLKVDPVLSLRIDQTARKMHITMNVFFEALWGILLERYNDSRDVVFGTVVSGRHAEIEDVNRIVGLLINTIPVRIKTEPGMKIRDVFKSVQEQMISSHAHDFCSLSEIQSRAGFSGNLFDHLVVFENYAKENALKALTGETGSFPFQIEAMRLFEETHYDFNLVIIPGQSLQIKVIYNGNCFREKMIHRILDHIKETALRILDNPGMLVDEISILSDGEEKILRQHGRFDTAGLPAFSPVHRAFEKAAGNDSPAVMDDEVEMTCSTLNVRANQLAWFLKEKGVGPEKIVGVWMERSAELVISLLAILKAGGAYLPMDAASPPARIEKLIRSSGMNSLLTTRSIAGRISVQIPVYPIDCLSEIGRYPIENPHDPVSRDQLMYVIYTSGSTGEPKGVMIEHGGFQSLLFNHQKMFQLTSRDRCTQASSPAFDAMALEIWPCLTQGASLYIVPDRIRRDPCLLKEWMLKRGITFSFQITPIAESLVGMPWPEKPLRTLCTGGDRLKHYPPSPLPFRFYNLYGPTEDSVVTTCFEVTGPCSGAPPIGTPLDGHWAAVCDEEGRLSPLGCTGELVIGGLGLARGYLNDSLETSKKFVESRFGKDRVYKTGDLVRWHENGVLEYIGRKDDQVEIGGHRIELGEVEQHLLGVPGIIDCTVTALRQQEALCAYYTSEEELEEDRIFMHLKNSLPPYMVPNRLMRLEKIPRNMNGKVDRSRLPDCRSALKTAPWAKPRNQVEMSLCECWQEVLGLREISIHDNFFNLGGNSLKAIEAQARLSSLFDIRIQDIYEYPSTARLASIINSRQKPPDDPAAEIQLAVEALKHARNMKSLEPELKCYRSALQAAGRRSSEGKCFGNILLTGATGFLGAHLLYDLLKNTDARIDCLVRRSGEQTASERLESRLQFYFSEFPDEWLTDRIQVLEGDLSQKDLGMSEEDRKKAAETDLIINAAADVRHFGHPDVFERSNILGVSELIRLTREDSPKVFHHISTMGVGIAYTQVDQPRLFTELDECCDLVFDNPYIQSKLHAETLLFRARESGLDARLYRVGNLMAHSETGRFQINISSNAFYNVLRHFVVLGLIPDIPYVEMDFSFIDQTSRILISLMAPENPEQETYHVYNPNTCSLPALGRRMSEAGRPTRIVPIHEFFNRLSAHAEKNGTHLNPQMLVEYLRTLIKGPFPCCIPQCEKMKRFIAHASIEWKLLDAEFMAKMLNYGEQVRFWQ